MVAVVGLVVVLVERRCGMVPGPGVEVEDVSR